MNPKVSIVIPCYNEEKRIVKFFDAYAQRVADTGLDYEFMMVDDGSNDSTLQMLNDRAAKNYRLHSLTHQPNKGRGYSVRQGVLDAKGEYIFETDIDASYDVPEMQKFIKYLDKHPQTDVVIASRELQEAEALINQGWLRMLAGKAFHLMFRFFFGKEFTDVMAGCKIYRHSAAMDIFRHQYDNEFLGAAETVFVAKKLGYKIVELPVQWTDDREGSKVRPFRAAYRTFFGLIKMQIRSFQGKYKK